MKMFILIASITLPMLGNSQQGDIVKVDSSKQFIYVVKTHSITKLTNVYGINSVSWRKTYTQSNGCILTSGLGNIKVQITRIIKENFTDIVLKIKRENKRFTICFLPRYKGSIADVWFSWEGTEQLFSENEMKELILKLKKIQVTFEGEGISDSTYCHTLSFGIFPKDFE